MSSVVDAYWHMKPNLPLAMQLAKGDLSLLVCDAVNLEGVAMTLPEVQILLDGITVGGHKLSDQAMAVNQGDAWRQLFEWVSRGKFELSLPFVLGLHQIAGKEEALAWGHFRTGSLTISGSDYVPPEPKQLDQIWVALVADALLISDIYDRAITVFLQMARAQFFWDVNKRMGRFMMNGLLLANGFPLINVPAKRQLEFNQLMLDFYSSNDMKPMNSFLRSCLHQNVIANFL